jgi:biotin operon repressor
MRPPPPPPIGRRPAPVEWSVLARLENRPPTPSPGQPSDLREVNARRLMTGVRELGPVSRPELARHLGLSAVTVASIARRLVADGVLVETGTRGQRVGRKAVVLDVAPTAGAAFVADVRLEDVRWRRLGLRGNVLAQGEFRLPPDADGLVERLAEVVTAGTVQRGPLEVVVAVPATVRADGTVCCWDRPGMLHAVHLPDRLALHLGKRVAPTHVHVVNDVNLAAIGEHRAGAALSWSRFAFIGVRATGIGMGLVLDGHLYEGANGRAGEIGNLRLGGDGTPLDERFARISAQALAELAKVLAVTFAVLDLDGVVVHSETERGDDWFSDLAEQLRVLVPFAIQLVPGALSDDAVLHGAGLVALDALWPRLGSDGTTGPKRPASSQGTA